jgi:hypothetical protein
MHYCRLGRQKKVRTVGTNVSQTVHIDDDRNHQMERDKSN